MENKEQTIHKKQVFKLWFPLEKKKKTPLCYVLTESHRNSVRKEYKRNKKVAGSVRGEQTGPFSPR